MKEIILTQGMVALVDDDDYEKVNSYNWQAITNGVDWYAVRTVYEDDGTQWPMRLHRFLMDAPDDLFVDHKNRNTLDCQRHNLRLATHSQNMANRIMPNANGYRGIDETTSGKWRARIRYNKEMYNLGSYETKEEAARAFDKKAIELHGEFAVLNFPEEQDNDD